MTVESAADRATFLADWGVTVTWSRSGTPSTLTGVFDRPAIVVEGAEVGLIDGDASLLVREADLPSGAVADDPVTVAGESQAFACLAIRPDGSGFAIVDLKKAA